MGWVPNYYPAYTRPRFFLYISGLLVLLYTEESCLQWVYHLLKAINEAKVAKYGDGPMNLKLLDEFLYGAVTLVQGGKLPPGSSDP